MADGEAWSVLPHGPIEKLTENLWRVEGSLPGMSLKRQMTVVKRADGKLVVHSAIAMDEPSMRELEAWGEPAFLIVPNAYHRLDAPRFKKRYPHMTVYAPKGSRAAIAKKVPVDGDASDFADDSTVRFERLAGIKDDLEGAMLVRSSDGLTVVLNDCVFNMPKKPDDFMGWLMVTVLGSAPGPRVSRLGKLTLLSDKAALRGELERFAAMRDLKRLIVAHGDVASGADAARALHAAAESLR